MSAQAIRFGREKRLLLGWLALVAPLPLPFNQVIDWPVLVGYLAAVGAFLHRAARDEKGWLPNWGLNLLGLLYLPVLVADFSIFWRGQLLRPLVQLALFAVAVKLFAITRESHKSQSLIGIFFVTLAAVGTSVHPAMLAHLLVMLVLFVVALTRFAGLHALAAFGRAGVVRSAPLSGFVAVTVLLTLVAAIPVFMVLPRIRSPYLVARAPTGSTLTAAAGFSDEIGLDAIGRLRNSRQVALRFALERPPGGGYEPRLKGATYDRYAEATWQRSRRIAEPLARSRDGFFRLSGERARERMRIWMRGAGATELPTPVEGVTLSVLVPNLRLDRGGAVSFAFPPSGALDYEVGLGSEPRSIAPPPEPDEALGVEAVGPRMRELAGRVMGDSGPVGERIARLERHLMQEYRYTLDFLGRGGADPIGDFLFQNRRGHCELFASSMVLLLRSQGVPARLVTGFLGADYNPLEGYWVVRQSNRHAWVEAWSPEAGWAIYDPTPAAGRPQAGEDSLARRLEQAWDYLVFRWDRYVLTYGVNEQLDVVVALRDLWRSLFGRFSVPEVPSFDATAPEPPEERRDGERVDEEPSLPHLGWVPLAVLFTLLAVWVWVRRPALTATRAYRRVRRRLGRAGVPVAESTPPLELHRRLAERFPEAEAAGGKLVHLYLEESFRQRQLSSREHEELVDAYRRTLRAARSA